MNPDSYMPYFGNEFEAATKGLRREVRWSYLAACWHYWHHTHCEGLPNDDAYLKAICDCPDADWGCTKGFLFGRFFALVDGKWHQKHSAKLHKEFKESYSNRVEAAARARAAKASPNAGSKVGSNDTTKPNKNKNKNKNKNNIKNK